MYRKIEVTPHNPKWQEEFLDESKQITLALGDNVIRIHHIGSTSIPTIYAKPIIDMLVEVKDINQVDQFNSAMEGLNYEIMGEYGIPGRRYFYKLNGLGIRKYHIHIFKSCSSEIKRHLAFRDYLIYHPEEARKYSELKRKLAKRYPYNIEKYMNGKDSFIKEIDRKAMNLIRLPKDNNIKS